MTPIEYVKEAMRTKTTGHFDIQISGQLLHAVLGLNSEAGEIAGLIQKNFQGHTLDRQHLMKELGDCMWFIAEICDFFDISMETVMEMNIEKLRNRYPVGFDTNKSKNREEGDI